MENNCIGIQLIVGGHNILLVNVYIKSDLWEVRTLNAYLEYLSQLEYLITNTQFESVFFMGDFNADPYSGRAWKNLCDFLSRNSLQCFDYAMLESSAFTFVSFGNTYCKWLDHIVGRNANGISVSSTRVLYDVIGSDHLPLAATITIRGKYENIQTGLSSNAGTAEDKYVSWNHLSTNDIMEVERRALITMGKYLDSDAVKCSRRGCRHGKHLREIDRLFDCLVSSVRVACESISKEKRRKNKYKVIPGWNRNVKHLHSIARQEYLNWICLGRVRDSDEFRRMNESRSIFKAALNDCKVNELRDCAFSYALS